MYLFQLFDHRTFLYWCEGDVMIQKLRKLHQHHRMFGVQIADI